MSTINGFGTKIYGKIDVAPDGSYTATEWAVFMYLPISPIQSYRIYKVTDKGWGLLTYESKEYLLKEIPLHKKQVREMYFTYAAIALGLFVFLVIMYFMYKLFDF
jgi:hypothetical protein